MKPKRYDQVLKEAEQKTQDLLAEVNPVQDAEPSSRTTESASSRAVKRTGPNRERKSPDRGQVVTLPARQETELQFIERVLKDPSFDPTKFDTLMKWRDWERGVDREEQFNRAMNAAQAEMRQISADSNNPQTRSRYASYAALDRVLRPIYTKHGFSISYNTAEGAPENHVRVVAVIRNGQHKEPPYHFDMPIVTKGIKGVDMMTLTHATISAKTYGQRNLLAMIFGIAVDKDDDGNAAGKAPVETLSEEQAKTLKGEIAESGLTEEQFCKHYKIEAVISLPASMFYEAVSACRREKVRREKAGKS